MTCSQVVGECEPLVHMPCAPASLPAVNAQATNSTSVQAVDNDTMKAPTMLSLSNLGSNNPTVEHLLAPHDVSSSNQHPMVTRSQSGVYKPNPKYFLVATVTDIPSEPKSVKSALKHPGWHAAMIDEIGSCPVLTINEYYWLQMGL